eukprot:m.632117 g.632117  ORF g.632117 m.632117 type:complete len:105 (-) comp58290_c0_seq7:2811-3125(-)
MTRAGCVSRWSTQQTLAERVENCQRLAFDWLPAAVNTNPQTISKRFFLLIATHALSETHDAVGGALSRTRCRGVRVGSRATHDCRLCDSGRPPAGHDEGAVIFF